jgi:hypothetical protein
MGRPEHNTLGGCAFAIPLTAEDEAIRVKLLSVSQDQALYDADMRDGMLARRMQRRIQGSTPRIRIEVLGPVPY